MFHVVWKWHKFPVEFFMPIHNLAFIQKIPLIMHSAENAEILQKGSSHIFPPFLFVVFQFARVSIKYPYLDMLTKVIWTSPLVLLTESQLHFFLLFLSMPLF